MKKTVLITGASSGIGRELARGAASQGNNLVVVARNIEKLDELKKELENKYDISVTIIGKDLSKPNAGKEIFEETKSKNIKIEYLINNAGFGGHGYFYEREWEKDRDMINVNIMALTELTRFFLPEMVKNNSGKILNIASTAAFFPGPLQAVYYATKSYVLSFSQGIAEEVRDNNITVTVFCPGATETEFAKRGNLEKTSLFKTKLASPDKVAKLAYKAMVKGKLFATSEPYHSFMGRFVIPFFSRRSVLKISKSYMETK